MTRLNKIDFLSWETKLSNIRRGKMPEKVQRKIDTILSIIPFYDDWLNSSHSQQNIMVEAKIQELPQILQKNTKVWLDAQNPEFKLKKIIWNTQAQLIENAKKDFWRVHEDVSIRDLKNIPDWVKNDSTISSLINEGIWKLVYYWNLSKETIQSLKLNFDKWFVYFDWLKYIFKRISCKKNIKDEIFEMCEDEFKKFWADEINDFLKA